jgi:hypothetical protein
VQRALRGHLVPSLVPVQPVRRPGVGDVAARQSPQREVLAAGVAAGNRTADHASRRCLGPVKKPLGQNAKWFLAKATGSAWPTGRKSHAITSTEGLSSVRIARGTPARTRNRRADWNTASRIANMMGLLPFGAYPREAYLGSPGSNSPRLRNWNARFSSCNRSSRVR